MLRVRDIMTRDPITVTSGASLRDVMELFAQKHISGAPVVDRGSLAGVISASDLLTFTATLPSEAGAPGTGAAYDRLVELEPDAPAELLDDATSDSAYFSELLDDADTDVDSRFASVGESQWSIIDGYTVAEAMTTSAYTIAPDVDAVAAAVSMRKAGVHRLLVVDEDRLVGIVSTSDITRAVAERRMPNPPVVLADSPDFDTGWSHEPVVREELGETE